MITPSEKPSNYIDEALSVLHSGDTDAILLAAAKNVLLVTEKFTGRLSENVAYDGFDVPFVLRCIARKATDTLSAALLLVEGGQAFSAVALLRPMSEELIFARYLVSLPRSGADRYLAGKINLEILEGLAAQHSFFEKEAEIWEREAVRDPWEPPDVSKRMANQKTKLKEIGKELGWGNRTSPTVKHMALATDSEEEYGFFYHASSNAVHASLQRLGRMAWRKDGSSKYSISGSNFEQYYRRFVLVYGAWLVAKTMDIPQSQFGEFWPHDEDEGYGVALATLVIPAVTHRAPGIVTQEELRR